MIGRLRRLLAGIVPGREPSYRFFLVEMPEGEVIERFEQYEDAHWHRFANRLGATRIMTEPEWKRWTEADRPRPNHTRWSDQ